MTGLLLEESQANSNGLAPPKLYAVGKFATVRQVHRAPGTPASYGLKAVREASPFRLVLGEEAQVYVDLNGRRPVRATHDEQTLPCLRAAIAYGCGHPERGRQAAAIFGRTA